MGSSFPPLIPKLTTLRIHEITDFKPNQSMINLPGGELLPYKSDKCNRRKILKRTLNGTRVLFCGCGPNIFFYP